MEQSTRSHEDIYNRQQATELHLERVDGKIDTILQMLQFRNQQSTEHRISSDKLLDEIRRNANEHAKAVWERFSVTDKSLEHIRQSAADDINQHKRDNDKALKAHASDLAKLDGKLLTLGGGLALLSFLLVIFAPIIQQQFLVDVPANGKSEHYELRK